MMRCIARYAPRNVALRSGVIGGVAERPDQQMARPVFDPHPRRFRGQPADQRAVGDEVRHRQERVDEAARGQQPGR
jgi:hypothetical protein